MVTCSSGVGLLCGGSENASAKTNHSTIIITVGALFRCRAGRRGASGRLSSRWRSGDRCVTVSLLWLAASESGEREPDVPGGRWRRRGSCSHRFLRRENRKSTRLNSSHANISYAVFCLKKKKNKK